ncbi:MAG: chaperonin GroEL [Planctomycetes bacterium]|nr:chaperonin GroEL [Planctomycetota bacterium]
MAKQLLFDREAREAVKHGVEKMALAVTCTLGPRGRSVVVDKGWGSPSVTQDGATVADEVELTDPYEILGAQMMKQAASKTSDEAGDGTTTATVLAQSIFREGQRAVVAGAHPMALNRGVRKGFEAVIAALAKQAKKVETNQEIKQIATLAAKNDGRIGELIAVAMEKVGRDGVITVEEGKGTETELKIVEGMQFDRGFTSPHFVTNADTVRVEFDNPYILIHEDKISTIRKLVPIMEAVSAEKKPLLIIAEEVEGEALATLVVNKLRGVVECCAVKAPGYGDRRKAMLEDIAVLTGGEFLGKDRGLDLEKIGLDALGRARRVVVDSENTTIVEGAGATKDIQGRIGQIRKEIEKATSDYDKEKLQERLAKLAGGVAQINVGAATESEMKEKKSRTEDALAATRAAIAEGIVPGGGVALVRCLAALDPLKLAGDEAIGLAALRRALEQPLRAIAQNAGTDGSIVLRKVKEGAGAFGWDAEKDVFGDLVAAGIVDPTKVVRVALQNAVSAASLLLTTECLITDVPEDREAEMAAHHHDH